MSSPIASPTASSAITGRRGKVPIPPGALDDGRWEEPGYAQKIRLKGRMAALFVKLWSRSVRVKRLGWENIALARSRGKPLLYLCWHGSQVVLASCWVNQGILILTSLSRDGDIQDVSLRTLGFRTIRGSSSRGGARALLGLVKEIKKHGAAALPVDSPRGPYHVAKPGAVLLAQKSEATILPVGIAHSCCHRLNNWDRFEIPVPFSRSTIVVGDPFEIPAGMSQEEGCRLIEARLIRCDELARQGGTA